MTARRPLPLVRGKAPRALFAPALLALALACTAEGPSTGPGTSDAGEGDARVAARVDGEAITVAEVDAWVKDQLFRQRTNGGEPAKLYEVRSEAVENLIRERLLEAEAESRGVSPEQLIAQEVAKGGEVSDEEVRAFYERHQQQVPGEFEDVAARIRSHLQRQVQGDAANAFLASLREQHDVEIALETPRLDVAATGPARGPEDAPVTIVEFSDYQCPYCRRAEPILEELLARYPDRVRLVYRHFPLDSIHPQARHAAEVAVCAADQGRFWELHERLFAHEDLGAEAVRGYAEEAGLDLEALEACLEQPETAARVEADLAAGRAAGVTGTPAFFVNGVPMRGARPVEDFVEVIERELAGGGASEGRG